MARHPKPIQINIPNPCLQDWDKMAPADQGRFCTHCQKTVIDFTAYTDMQLYEFFTKHSEHTCGRYLASQVNRDICIPYQPHSKLYKWVIAAGLVLIFNRVPVAHAQSRSPHVSVVPAEKGNKQSSDDKGAISGKVVDEKKEPVIGAIVQVSQGGFAKGGAATDVDGNYIIQSLPEGGNYEIRAAYTGYMTKTVKRVEILKGAETKVNFILELNAKQAQEAVFIGYKIPLIEIGHPYGILDAKDIKHSGITKPAEPLAVPRPRVLLPQKKVSPNVKLHDLDNADIKKPHTGLKKHSYTNPNHINKEDIDHIH